MNLWSIGADNIPADKEHANQCKHRVVSFTLRLISNCCNCYKLLIRLFFFPICWVPKGLGINKASSDLSHWRGHWLNTDTPQRAFNEKCKSNKRHLKGGFIQYLNTHGFKSEAPSSSCQPVDHRGPAVVPAIACRSSTCRSQNTELICVQCRHHKGKGQIPKHTSKHKHMHTQVFVVFFPLLNQQFIS